MYPRSSLKWLGGLFAYFSILVSPVNAQTTNLIFNGDFGTATYGANGTSIFKPGPGWNGSAQGSLQAVIKSQVVEPTYSQFSSTPGAAYNWQCWSGYGRVLMSTEQIGAIKANTRYRFSFHIFKDITNIPATDPAYSTTEGLSLFLQNGSSPRGNYLLKDISMSPKLFGSYKPGVTNSPVTFEFTTPAGVGGASNQGASVMQFRWPSAANKGAMCVTSVRLEELPQKLKADRVVVNTQGYPLLGSKVATLVLGATTSTTGLKWQLRENGGPLTGSYGVGITFYAAVTGADGKPLLDTATGKYSLQKNPDGTNKVVGGTGTGGQMTSSAVAIPVNALALDADSGDLTYTIDFSSYGKSLAVPPQPINLAVAPSSTYTANDGKTYYIYSQSTTNSAYYACRSCTIEVRNSSNAIIATSLPFSTQSTPYQSLKNDALYTFYHQRSGEDIAPAFIPSLGYNYANGSMYHVAGHKPDSAKCWANGVSNLDLHGNDWGAEHQTALTTQDVSGGWYDAADHGKYVVNGGVALWALQNMIERLQTKGTLSTAFPSGKLKLPNNPGYSDLMAEAKVEMEWMLKMQVPYGFKMKVPLGNQDKTQTGTPGKGGTQGVYQVDRMGNPLASTAYGDISFGGGKLPRLRTKLNLTEVNVSGLVFHAVHDRNWTGIPQNPSKDTQERVLMYPTTAATLNFVAVAAQCSRIWKTVDPTFANTCFDAANKAWTAAKKFRDGSSGDGIPASSDIYRYEYTNQTSWRTADDSPTKSNFPILEWGFAVTPMFEGGGAYGDLRVGDEFYWAGAELYLATAARNSADVTVLTYGKSQGGDCAAATEPVQCYSWINGFDWQNTSALGTLSLLTYNGGTLARASAKSKLVSYADELVAKANLQGYKFSRLPFVAADRNTHYEWGSNGGILNRAIILGAAADIQTDATLKAGYIDVMVNSMGYLLGRNTLEKSFISGYGNNAMANPHHRWFAKHADVAYPAVPAGYIAGGTNTRDIPALRANAPRYQTQADVNYALANGDPDAVLGGIADASQKYFEANVVANCMNEGATTAPAYVPQKCYADHYRSFATNEVAINWQASLVWVAQYLSENY